MNGTCENQMPIYLSSYRAPMNGDQRTSNRTTHPTATQFLHADNTHSHLSDKVILITGCSSGLGAETARVLARTDARLFLAVRDVDKGRRVLGDILDGERVRLLRMDLASFESIRHGVREFAELSGARLNVLIANGGVMMTPADMRTVEELEMQMGVNHLGHFLLLALLRQVRLRSVDDGFQSRVVGLTSSAHRGVRLPLDDMDMVGVERGEYSPRLAYGQSKLANIYMMNEIDRRYGRQGLHGLSVHPGGILTGLQQYVEEVIKQKSEDPEVRGYLKSVEQGAATTVMAAIGKEWEGVGGRYLEDCTEGGPVRPGCRDVDPGYDECVHDQKAAERLWEWSEEMVGLQA